MIRAPSRPGRALRRAGVIAGLALVWRIPTIEREFEAALSAAAEPLQAVADRTARPVRLALAVLAKAHLRPDVRQMPTATGRSSSHREARPTKVELADALRNTSISSDFAGLNADDGRAFAPLVERRAEPSAPLRPTEVSAAPDAGALATAAYTRLTVGDRRGAVRLFDAALVSDDPRTTLWRAQRNLLIRRWSATAYSIVRSGSTPGSIPTPVLGGGQSGGGIALAPDPLSPRPLAITLRGSAGHDDNGRTGFAAVGLQWRPLPQITVAAERLIAVGPAAHDEWTLRLAGGLDQTHGRRRTILYGESGVIGHAAYAAVQGQVAAVIRDHGLEINPGAGFWSSLQRDRRVTVDRVDVGPGVTLHAGPLAVEVDYRFRIAGNAAPRTGPVLTISAAL